MLDEIIKAKKQELIEVKQQRTLQELEDAVKDLPIPRNFSAALSEGSAEHIRIIAEVKKASPSKGIICENFSPVRLAKAYESHGAAALSVLTEKRYFMGNLEYLRSIKNQVLVPVLRKDFIFEPYQIYEARFYGADAVLLIVAILSEEQLIELLQLANSLSLFHLVEVHTRNELIQALGAGAKVIGINNRNLHTFKTDLNTTRELIKEIPDNKIIVSESGITSRDDILKLKSAGVNAFLIGETLMREKDPGLKLHELIGNN